MANEIAPIKKKSGRRVSSLGGVEREAGHAALLEFQSPTAALVARPLPITSRITVWVITAMFASIVTILWVMPVDQVVMTSGTLVAKTANVLIQPLETSIVRQVNVKVGQVVRKGDLLAQLDPTFSGSDQNSYAQQAEILQATVDRLTAEDDHKSYKPASITPSVQVQQAIYASRQAEFDYKIKNYDQQIAGLKATLDKAVGDVAAYRQRLEVAKVVEQKRRDLERLQVGSQLNTLAAVDSRLDLERNLQEAQQTITSSAAALQAMMHERDGFVHQWRADLEQQLSDASAKLADARNSLEHAALRRQMVDIYAPEDAVVLSVAKVSPGSVMQSGDQFLTLVPLNAELEAEVLISGDQTGYVHVGDPATVKFDSFPEWEYGNARGTVRTISADSFTNPNQDPNQVLKPQLDDNSGLGVAYYRARVSVDQIKLHDLPPSFRLTPGMPLKADITVGKNTVIGYLLGKILPHVTESFREP